MRAATVMLTAESQRTVEPNVHNVLPACDDDEDFWKTARTAVSSIAMSAGEQDVSPVRGTCCITSVSREAS